MKGMTLGKIAEAAAGTLYLSVLKADGSYQVYEEGSPAGADEAVRSAFCDFRGREIQSVTTDSRKAEEGSLFAAIVGARADGHRFIASVYDRGALCVFSERELAEEDLFTPEARSRFNGCGEESAKSLFRPWILVRDTQTALGAAAALYLDILGIPVTGVTGSVGKTSTKEMIASVLSRKLRTLKTEGNFNNDLGLPLTVFRLTEEDEIAVLEMGISHFGDMHRLAKIARPDTAVITNIGTCHLEYLENRDGVLRAKTEIFDHVRENGHILLNGNDDKLRTVHDVKGRSLLFFGVSSEEEGTEELSAGSKVTYPPEELRGRCVCASDIRPLGFDGSLCRMDTPEGSFELKVPVPGIHNISNAAAATAVGLTYGLSFEQIREGIAAMQTISGRFRILHTPAMTVIDDCYNANPVSMKSSLKVLAGCDTRRVAILGDMGELGKDEIALHREVGAYAAGCTDRLIVIGTLGRYICDAALEARPELPAVWYASVDEFLEKCGSGFCKGDTVLVKASHFMNFPRIVEALTAGQAE